MERSHGKSGHVLPEWIRFRSLLRSGWPFRSTLVAQRVKVLSDAECELNANRRENLADVPSFA